MSLGNAFLMETSFATFLSIRYNEEILRMK